MKVNGKADDFFATSFSVRVAIQIPCGRTSRFAQHERRRGPSTGPVQVKTPPATTSRLALARFRGIFASVAGGRRVGSSYEDLRIDIYESCRR